MDRRAVIDVGTNSVKLLVADVRSEEVIPLLESSSQTRLGQGLYRTHLLQPDAITRTVNAVAGFIQEARKLKAGTIRLYATSAAREADNGAELMAAIQQETGLVLETISAETEAEWAFRGVLTHRDFAGQDFLLLDLGGGSAQFIVGAQGHARFDASYPLGCVRWLEKTPLSDPPTSAEKALCCQRLRTFLQTTVFPTIHPHMPSACQWVGIGGTATILGRMELGMTGFDRERLESLRLPVARLREWRDRLWAMPLQRRRLVVGLPANRADVILMGTAVFTEVSEVFGFQELRISTRGARYGAFLDLTQSAPDKP